MATESAAPPDAALHAAAPSEPPESAHKGPVKRSWRRKYRKMRARFEDTMHASNTLIKDEYKAVAVARRLQEQNDQILEVLLDMNESKRLPANLQFDLREPSDTDVALAPLDVEAGPEALQRKLQELRADLVAERITAEEFAQKSDQLNAAHSITLSRTLAALETSIPHSTRLPQPTPEGIMLGDHAPGYMSPGHEEEYLLAIDAALADPAIYNPNAHDGRPLRITTSRPIPSEKELTIQNPDSVYNWLRKHQPQVFLQDKDTLQPENVSEKSSARPANTSGRKRPSAVSAATPGPKAEPDGDDDTGFIPETGTSAAKGRRGKQEDDFAYRPNGGSGRSNKRKREAGDSVGKGGRKKGRTSGGAATST